MIFALFTFTVSLQQRKVPRTYDYQNYQSLRKTMSRITELLLSLKQRYYQMRVSVEKARKSLKLYAKYTKN